MSPLKKHPEQDDMPSQYYSLGSPLDVSESLSVPCAQYATIAISKSRYFERIENRRYVNPQAGRADVIIVNCLDDKVPSRNQYGIKNRERLALVFYENAEQTPETLALRKTFPVGFHQNAINEGDPISLCLYEEPWTSIRHHWTAENHLKKILWWLENSARGSLHQKEQSLEPFFFSSGVQLVLPPNFDERLAAGSQQLLLSMNGTALLAFWREDIPSKQSQNTPRIEPIIVSLPPLEHSGIERIPKTLGRLEEVFSNRGGSFIGALKAQIRGQVNEKGIVQDKSQRVLLILHIPLSRHIGETIEKVQNVGFLIQSDFCSFGESLDILSLNSKQKRFFKFELLGDPPPSSSWKNFEITPVDVAITNTVENARVVSDICEEKATFLGVLAGLGSLGSALAQIWSDEGWGGWTYIDHDRVAPHNLYRYNAEYIDIGQYKVHVVAQRVSSKYYPGYHTPIPIADSVITNNPDVKKAIGGANLFIDATTTLEVSREMAVRETTPRSISVFFTPNGLNSVLLCEDSKRTIRLDSLEVQYYRAILKNDWGKSHLEKHRGDLWVGNGCRDISTVIPTELIQMHSAILARKIRVTHDQDNALICIFQYDDESGLSVLRIKPKPRLTYELPSGWVIVFDEGLTEELFGLRTKKLPKETGGILLGFIDHKIKRICIVAVVAAPFDSEETSTSFVRGTKGVIDIITEAQRRTAGIVTYLGEWHSHPQGCRAKPSGLDLKLLNYLGEQLAEDGQPGLMAIVGEKEICFMTKSTVENG